MKYNIKTKLSIAFSLVLLIFIAIITSNFVITKETRKQVSHINKTINKQVEYSHSLKVSAIEIQQWITDASLTKSADSMKEAENYKELFKQDMQKLEVINPSLKDKLDALNSKLDEFYSLGMSMENAYATQGQAKGNELMSKFDPMTEEINKQVDELNALSSSAMQNDINGILYGLSEAQYIGFGAGGLAIIMVIIIVMILGRKITEPIDRMLVLVKDLESGDGDLTKRIDVKSKDEIGEMADELNKFLDKMESMISGIKKNTDVVASEAVSLSSMGKETSQGIERVNVHMNKVTKDNQNISESINEITTSISEIATASQATANDSQEISSRAQDINVNALESGKLAMAAKTEMEKIEALSGDTIRVTNELGSQAKEIGKIIDTIKDITSQTNLLALNAAIEAARAGDQGKGFGIVAEEIRKLAESNNQSAKTIEDIVGNIQGLIEETVAAAADSETNIKRGGKMVEDVYKQLEVIIEEVGSINNKIQNIAAGTEEQSASTQELSATMESINNSNIEISSAIQEIASNLAVQTETIGNLSSTSQSLSGSSERLDGLVNRFKVRLTV